MFRNKSDLALASSLALAVFLWGANNTGTKFIVSTWPPLWTGGTRFLSAGLLLLAVLRHTSLFGTKHPLTAAMKVQLWWRGGLSLAVYLAAFNWALRCTSASHVALYLGASPVWALLWEQRPTKSWASAQRYAAALLALSGVVILFWPALKLSQSHWLGEGLGLAASILWTNFGLQARALGATLSGPEVTAHTMWRAGAILLPFGLVEVWRTGLVWRVDLFLIHLYCIVAGSVVAFGIWNNALRRWPSSRVMLFNNLIPLSTMVWAHFCLGEPVTATFWLAMMLIVAGVVLGQTNWKTLLPMAALPPE